jgi:transcriptional regulator with XRE-family HTH domain
MNEIPKSNATGITGIRAKLAENNPKFAKADSFEQNLERLLVQLRDRLKEARIKRGVGQSELASRMQVGQPLISRIENGVGDIGLKTLYRYAGALDLTLTIDLDEKDAPGVMSPYPAVTDAIKDALKALESINQRFVEIGAASAQMKAV